MSDTPALAQQLAAAAAVSPAHRAAVEADLRQALLTRALEADGSLGFTDEELAYLPREIVVRLWRKTYAALVAAMPASAEIDAWAAAMTARYGDGCRVHGHPVSWPAALRIVRWGEEPRHWPAAWDAADLARAQSWLAGAHPAFVVYQDGSSPNPGARVRVA